MRTLRRIDLKKFDYIPGKTNTANHRDGKLSVTTYSGFFSSVGDNIMCTNAMYASLHTEIESALSIYSEKEPVSLVVYETSSSDEDTKESVLVGFRKYVAQNLRRANDTLHMHLLTFTLLCAVGILIEYLLYGAFPGHLPVWLENVLDIVAWVFVWQFAAYMAFDFVRERKAIRRLDQILNIEFVFRHWE